MSEFLLRNAQLVKVYFYRTKLALTNLTQIKVDLTNTNV
ncbi:MAG: hypothetical protein JJP05_09780 [cyanobacterium endosymbiont of Rhopalodia gibba]